jgi:hypothetical protein
MQSPNSTSPLVVEDPRTGRLLSDVKEIIYLAPLVNRQLSAKQYSRGLKLGLHQGVYRLKRLKQLGLIRVAREEQRKGSPIKFYQATASRYFVPIELLSDIGLESWLQQTFNHFDVSFVAGILKTLRGATRSFTSLGLEVYFEGDQASSYLADHQGRKIDIDLFLSSEESASLSLVYVIGLSFDDAKSLQRDLVELLKKYPSTPSQKRYVVRVSLAELL